LNREIFYTLEEAKVLIKNWRREYNAVRPDSSLGYRPTAPEALATEPPRVLRRVDYLSPVTSTSTF
jgi:transposase InsO family protein